MTDAEGLVDAVARAFTGLHIVDFSGEGVVPAEAVARAALEAISAAGWAVVPVVPTGEIMMAGSEAGVEHEELRQRSYGLHAAELWKAMLAAAPKVPS